MRVRRDSSKSWEERKERNEGAYRECGAGQAPMPALARVRVMHKVRLVVSAVPESGRWGGPGCMRARSGLFAHQWRATPHARGRAWEVRRPALLGHSRDALPAPSRHSIRRPIGSRTSRPHRMMCLRGRNRRASVGSGTTARVCSSIPGALLVSEPPPLRCPVPTHPRPGQPGSQPWVRRRQTCAGGVRLRGRVECAQGWRRLCEKEIETL